MSIFGQNAHSQFVVNITPAIPERNGFSGRIRWWFIPFVWLIVLQNLLARRRYHSLLDHRKRLQFGT